MYSPDSINLMPLISLKQDYSVVLYTIYTHCYFRISKAHGARPSFD